MDVLILGGQSPRHYDWVREVADTLRGSFKTVAYLDYRHWEVGGDIDMAHEITEAEKFATSLKDYVIVAKSIGSIIATYGIAANKLKPQRCIFLGFPLTVVQRSYGSIADALSFLPETVFIQNDHDPVGSAQAVQLYVTESTTTQVQFITTDGDTHDYTDFTQIQKLAVNKR